MIIMAAIIIYLNRWWKSSFSTWNKKKRKILAHLRSFACQILLKHIHKHKRIYTPCVWLTFFFFFLMLCSTNWFYPNRFHHMFDHQEKSMHMYFLASKSWWVFPLHHHHHYWYRSREENKIICFSSSIFSFSIESQFFGEFNWDNLGMRKKKLLNKCIFQVYCNHQSIYVNEVLKTKKLENQ